MQQPLNQKLESMSQCHRLRMLKIGKYAVVLMFVVYSYLFLSNTGTVESVQEAELGM